MYRVYCSLPPLWCTLHLGVWSRLLPRPAQKHALSLPQVATHWSQPYCHLANMQRWRNTQHTTCQAFPLAPLNETQCHCPQAAHLKNLILTMSHLVFLWFPPWSHSSSTPYGHAPKFAVYHQEVCPLLIVSHLLTVISSCIPLECFLPHALTRNRILSTPIWCMECSLLSFKSLSWHAPNPPAPATRLSFFTLVRMSPQFLSECTKTTLILRSNSAVTLPQIIKQHLCTPFWFALSAHWWPLIPPI